MVITQQHKAYPQMLFDLPKPPVQLFCRGNVDLLKTPCVSIVGSRKTTEYGRWAAATIAAKLAANEVTVVSGLAIGIDGAAHQGALDAGGNTIAVLGCGLDIEYPMRNKMLRKRIEEKGLVITEYSSHTMPAKYTFPLRNRIISSLSQCTVVIEAGLHSGALHTADVSLQLNRAVYAVPGNINSTYSFGSNTLIRQGAQPIMHVDDILDFLGISENKRTLQLPPLGSDERRLYNALSNGSEKTVDQLSKELSMGAGKINGIITVLEMKGLVYTALGKVFISM